MKTPERDDLRRSYEDLADEILIEIALNTQKEYEQVAVEVAEIELSKRGVNVPRHDTDGRAGAVDDMLFKGPLVEIPRFSEDETAEIDALLSDESIPFHRQAVCTSSCSGCESTEYVYFVQESSFARAVERLRDYYVTALEAGSSQHFSGECPACGTVQSNVEHCIDCGLALAGDITVPMQNHPFVQFLEKHKLI